MIMKNRKGSGTAYLIIGFIVLSLVMFEGHGGYLGVLGKFVNQTFSAFLGTGKLACKFAPGNPTMPTWQCFIIYGAFPFTIAFFMFEDLLVFTMFRSKTKMVLAATMALFMSIGGGLKAFTSMLLEILSYVVPTSKGYGQFGFFGLIILMGIASAVLGQFGLLMSSASNAAAATTEMYYGMQTMRAIGKSVTKEEK